MGTIQKLIKSNPKPVAYLLIGFIVITAAALIVLPADYFDDGRAKCLSVILLNRTCYGCGMTRAVQHLIHLDFEAAWAFNPLSFIVLPLFVGMLIWEISRRLNPIGNENKK